MNDERNMSRRDLLKQGTVTAAASVAMPMVVARALEAAQDPGSVADKSAKAAKEAAANPIKIAWIGSGVQGQNDLKQLVKLPGVQIVAIADVYEPSQKKGAEIAGP